jgi:D-alanyl-D-alanine carboxypeptidase
VIINMLKKILVIFFLIFFFFYQNASANSSISLRDYIKNWQQQNKIPAVAFILKSPQMSFEYLSGTSIENGKSKIRENSLFGVGSITKTFVAATILQLQESHQLNLNDSLDQYFPQYPRWKKITIRQLLNMSSGISNFTLTDTFKKLIKNDPAGYHPLSFFVNLAYMREDQFSAGQGWNYSNTNYYLLGMLIEKITHHSLADEFHQRFFKPLHLQHSYYSGNVYPHFIDKKRVHAYLNDKDVTNENPAYYGPAGGMVMNTQDLVTWIEALFTPGKVLTKKSINELMKTQAVPFVPPKPKNARYGLGVYSLNIPKQGLVWWYTGVVDGYSSVFMWIPSRKIILAAQINRWTGNDFGILMPDNDFLNTILKTIETT